MTGAFGMAMDNRAGKAVAELVSGFRANLAALRDPEASEAVVRSEYVDPFWKALGWDVANSAHRSHAEKDVLIEAPVGTIEGESVRHRRPDYLFRIDGFPRFVVEAKKPSVDVRGDRDSIFQAKTYAWSAQIPFAILTNFERFRLFDTTIKPYVEEPGRGLVEDFDLTYGDYAAQWDVIWQAFSRDAVAGGSLERLLAKLKKVRAGRRIRGFDRMLFDLRGTEPVDQVFLKHLEDYRLRFARAIYQDNRARFREADTHRGAAELAEATQRLIDRLVFMRVCEDRGIINYGTLREAVEGAARNRLDLYGELAGQFREFDARFNGYLFQAHFSEGLAVSGELLADFIRTLYQPEGPYRFDAIADDLLGIIYERFLGSSITVARGNVEAKPKPEVRHAGGVYYTPRFVVDTIIRRVVAPKLEGKTPSEVRDVRILDPACGSGSFLIAAYQYLVDYCCGYLAGHADSAQIPSSPRGRGRKRKIAAKNREGQWLLTPEFKAELLTSCIHGVDIDAQAVEVTVMSLYLKTLENMPEGWQRGLMEHRLLPPLDNNIKCGNSLLSRSDFDKYWDEKNGTLFSCAEDVAFRINAFDWSSDTHGFGRVFAGRQGFDCVVGNPPYIRVQELNKWAPEECGFYKWRYGSAAKGNYDIYVVFMERALELLDEDGLLGLICPHKFWQATYGAGIRRIVAERRHLQSVVDFTDQQVFHGATTYTAIHVLSRKANRDGIRFNRVVQLTDGDSQCRALEGRGAVEGATRFVAQYPTSSEPFVFVDAVQCELLQKLRDAGRPLSGVADAIFVGLQTSADDVFILESSGGQHRSAALGAAVELETGLLHPLLKGSVHIRRWVPDTTTQVVLFPYEATAAKWRLISAEKLARRWPKTWDYLARCRQRLSRRERGTFEGDGWYGYVYPKNLARMGMPKILTPSLGRRAEFCLDETGGLFFVGSGGGGGGGYGITLPADLSPHYVLGLLNSKLLDWFVKQITTRFHSGWYAYNKQYIEQIPIKLPANAQERKLAGLVAERVQRTIGAKKQLQMGVAGDRTVARLQREIETHEQQIDDSVCRLYGVDQLPEDN
jgi:type I restriction-modification system DNA methylase subunit